MMKRATLLTVAGLFGTSAFAGSFTSDDILKIEVGMTKAQVQALIGRPRLFGSGSIDGGITASWLYRDKETKTEVRVTYLKNKVLQVPELVPVLVLEAYGKGLKEGTVKLGATRVQVKAALGEAYRHVKVNQTVTKDTTREQWVIGERHYLYFENGIVTSMQNSR